MGGFKSWILLLEVLLPRCDIWVSTPGRFSYPLSEKVRDEPIAMPQISRRIGGNLYYFLSFPFFVLRCAQLIVRNKIDVVHCNALYMWQPMLAAKLCGRKLVTHVREAPEKYPAFLYAAWVLYASALADKLLFVSKRDMTRFRRKDSLYVPNWISVEATLPDIAEELDLPRRFREHGHEEAVKLVVVSHFTRGKGQDFAIDILRELKKRMPSVCLYLAGGTLGNANNRRFRRFLEKKTASLGLSKDVVFLGEIKNVQSLMQKFDCALMPSQMESFSRVHLEAMSAGCFLAATDVGSTRELIEDFQTGVLIDYGRAAEAADKIARALGDPALVGTMRDNARRKVLAEFTERQRAEPVVQAILEG